MRQGLCKRTTWWVTGWVGLAVLLCIGALTAGDDAPAASTPARPYTILRKFALPHNSQSSSLTFINRVQLSGDRRRMITTHQNADCAAVWELNEPLASAPDATGATIPGYASRGLIANLPMANVEYAALNSDGSQAVTASTMRGVVQVWDVATVKVVAEVAPVKPNIRWVAFLNDKQVAVLFNNPPGGYFHLGSVEVYSADKMTLEMSIANTVGWWRGDGWWAVESTVDDATTTTHSLHLYRTGVAPRILHVPSQPRIGNSNAHLHYHSLLGVAVRPDGEQLAYLADTGNLGWIDLTGATPQRSTSLSKVGDQPWLLFEYSLDSTELAISDGKKNVRSFRSADGTLAQTTSLATVMSTVALTPDGRGILTTRFNSAGANLYDRRSGAEVAVLQSLQNYGYNDNALFPLPADRYLVPRANWVELWGPDPQPLANDRDPMWTAWMAEQGLKYSLFTAVVFDSPAEVQALLAQKPEQIDWPDGHGGTALFYAIAAGRRDMTAVLLKAGADPNHLDSNRLTPLALAFQLRDLETLKLLEQSGARVEREYGHWVASIPPDTASGERRYAQVRLQNAPRSVTNLDLVDWVLAHPVECEPQRVVRAVREYEYGDMPVAQRIYDYFQSQTLPTYLLVLMQAVLTGLAGLRIWRQMRKADDPQAQEAQAEATRLRAYHENSWGDDGAGRLGLYPEEQRELERLRVQSDGPQAAPLPAILACMIPLMLFYLHEYWRNDALQAIVLILLVVTGLVWIASHLSSSELRLITCRLGLLIAVVGTVVGILTGITLPGVSDLSVRWLYIAMGLAYLPMAWLYRKNLPLLKRIRAMEAQAEKIQITSNEEVKSDAGWDEKRPDIF